MPTLQYLTGRMGRKHDARKSTNCPGSWAHTRRRSRAFVVENTEHGPTIPNNGLGVILNDLEKKEVAPTAAFSQGGAMGGLGSGREADFNRKRCIEDCVSIDIRHLVRRGVLEPGRTLTVFGHSPAFEQRITTYLLGMDDAPADTIGPGRTRKLLRIRHMDASDAGYTLKKVQSVGIVTSQLRQGGLRHWLFCPGLGSDSGTPCGRRVALLHLPPGSEDFACRHCHDLVYIRQQIAASVGTSSVSGGRIRPRRSRSNLASIFEKAPVDAGTVVLFEDDPVANCLFTKLKYELKRLKISPGDGTYDRLMAFFMDELRKARRPKPSIDALHTKFKL